MSFYSNWILRAFLCLLLSAPLFAAGEQTIRVGIDRDNDTTTGCEFDPGTGDIRQGVDIVLEVVINADVSPPMIFATRYQLCRGDSFGPSFDLGAGWPVGVNVGIGGADVVEAALPVFLLGQTQTIRINAGIADNRGSDDTNATLTFSSPVPALGTLAFFAFIVLLLAASLWVMRRNRQRGLLVLLGLSLVAATGGPFILDGQIGDWSGVGPLITDPQSEPGTTDATDIVGLFACLEGDDRLVLRLDIVDLENDPPLAMDDTFKTQEDVPAFLDVLTNDSDPDLDALEIVQVTNPASGTAVLQGDGTILYTPNLNAKGSDTFTYTISDPVGLTDTAQVTVEVAADGDPPVGVDDSGTTDEDTNGNLFAVLNNDFDPDTGDILSIASVGTPSNGGTAMVTGADIEYSPAPDFFGTETVIYTVQDLSGKTDTATLTITVNNVNDDPDAGDDVFTVDEDSSNNAFDVLINDTDAPDVGETLTISSVGLPDNGGTATMIGGGTSIEYTPAADFFGTEIFTYTIGDGNGGSDTATVTVTVNNINDPVTAVDDAFSASEDGVTNSGDLLANDIAPDGGLGFQFLDITSSEGAILTPLGDGSLDYAGFSVPPFQALDDGETASDSFTYVAEDADGDTDMAVVTVTVNGANDAPLAIDLAETVNQNESIVIQLSGTDVDIENLTFSIITNPANGTLGAVTSTGPTTAEVTYTHSNLNTDPDSFTYLVNDGTVDSAAATVGLTIIPNVAPTANDDGSLLSPLVIQRDSFLDIDVAANDMDSDGTLDLTTVVPTNGTRGNSVATGGGIVRYTANPAEIGPDNFTYTINDDDGATSNSAGVFVFINDPPVAMNDMVALAEGTTTTISILTNDMDSDGTLEPTSVIITSNVGPGEGITTVNADGSVAYDPDGYVGLTSFEYTVMDDLGGTSNIATVMINVSPAPTATNDDYFVYGHTTVTVPASLGVLLNDTDDGLITANSGTFPTDNGGSITINSDGSFTYTTPGPGAVTPPSLGGTDSFTYTIQDKLMSSDTATITFTYEKVVWFTNNTNASGTEDGSQADPFNSLGDAEAAAASGHTFFVFQGDGTTTGQDAGIVLLGSQELIGEIAGLAVDVDGMGPGMPISIIGTGNRPVLTNTGGDVIVLDDSNLVTGLELQPQASAGILAGELKKMRPEKPLSYREQRQQGRLPRDWFTVGGDTEISNIIVSIQNDFSEGMVFLGQTGNLTLSDITITGPAGKVGFGGLIFDTCLVNATITNLDITDTFDSVVLAGNFGSSFAFENLTVETSDGLGFLAFFGGNLSITGPNNTLANFFGEGIVLDTITIAPAGVNLATVDVETCNAGIILDTVDGGPFDVTGAVTITDMTDNGIEVADSEVDVTFGGLVDIAFTGDDGIDLSDNTGSIEFQMPVTVTIVGDDGLDLQGADGTITFQDTVTINGAMDAGIELNGNNMGTPMGSTSFLGTVDIDNAGFAGLFVFDILNDVSFTTLDIDTADIGGAIFDGADILGTFSVAQIDINPGTGSQVGLGFVDSSGIVDVNGGTLENVEGEIIGLINSSMTFTFAGSATQVSADNALILVDADDTSNATFEAGAVLVDMGGDGLQFEDADGTYIFDTPITVTGNDDDGIDISTSSTGIFTFNAAVTLNTASGMAVRHAGGLGSELSFSGGLDIDTTTGPGFMIEGGSGTVSATGTNTVDTTSGDPVRIDMPIAAPGVTFQSVNSSAGGAIQISDSGSTGSFNITGTGTANGSGGTLMGGAMPLQISAATAVRYNIRNLNIEEFTTNGIDIQATQDATIFGTWTNVNVTSTQMGAVGVNLLGNGNSMTASYNQRTLFTGGTIDVDQEGILAQSIGSNNFGLVSLTLNNSSITSASNSAVRGFVNERSNLCLSANGNSPLVSAMFDFELEQTATGIITISQDSIAALQAANDGGTATVSTSGTISTGRVCPAP